MKIGLVGPTYQERSLPFDAQRTVNLYPVIDQMGKEVSALYGTPGLSLFSTAGSGPGREVFASTNGRFFVVSGSQLFEIDAVGGATARGSLDTSSGNCLITENRTQLCISDGTSLYVLTYATNAFAKVTDPDLPSVGTVTYIDGYFAANQNSSGRFYISDINNGLSWNALQFASAESSPDVLLRVINAVGQLWLFGEKSTEIWTNTGASPFPFERISGAVIEVGILSPYSALPLDNSVFWIGNDRNGAGIVYRAAGFSPQRISTDPIDRIIQTATNQAAIKAFSYQEDGHTFYCLTGGGLPTTLCYDLNTQQWHERAYLSNGGQTQALQSSAGYAFGRVLVGDRLTGKIYEQKLDFYTDNGDPIQRERIYTHIVDEDRRIRYNKLVIGFETGVGLQTGQGTNPLVSMQLSKDGARTWSEFFNASIGRVGEYMTKVAFRRLGIAEQMTFRIRISEPVKVAICGSYLE